MSDRKFTCEDIARELGNGREQKNGDGSWNTKCPAHNDGGPSLTVSEKNGRVLVHCHAGCNQEDVLQALRDRGLWAARTKNWTPKPHAPKDQSAPIQVNHPKLGRPSRSWVYRNRAGYVAGIIHRFDYERDGKKGKELIPMTWCMSDEGEQKFWWKQMAEPRPLYNEHRLSEIKPILVVEGEKACDKAQEIFGDDFLCLTWPGGSKAVKRANWSQLKGRDVVIWPDADEPGDKAARWLAEILIEVGVKSVKRVPLPDGLPEGWDLADDLPDDMKFDPKTLIRMAEDYRPQGDAIVEKYNREFALVMIGGQAVVLHEEKKFEDGRVDLRYMSIAGFKEFYGNRQVIVGKQQVPESTYWLKHEERRSFTNVVFEPSRDTHGAYNLWRGFSYDPDPTSEWTLLEEHIRQNLAKGDESLYNWIIAFFASIIQKPHVKSGTSLAFRGKQGTGKTIIGKAMGALYRPHYVLVEDSRYVLGNFNSHMASTLLLHADEAFFAGDPRHIGKLKGMVTSDTHRIEMKGKDSFEVNNHIRLLVTSNNDFIIPASFEERRFAVLDAGEGRIQDKVFFKALWKQLENGGFGGLLYHLTNFDLSTTDATTIPSTNALQEQKMHSLDGVMRFWYERLWQGQLMPHMLGWPEMVSVDDLYECYIKRSEDWGERRRVDLPVFGKELRAIWPGNLLRKEKARFKRTTRDGFSNEIETYVYRLYSLERHRQAFSQVSGKIEWPDDELIETAPEELVDDIPF